MHIYWSKTYNELINYFDSKNIKVILMGIRASYYIGLPIYRLTEDLDISVTASLENLRDTITNDLRNLGFAVQWKSWEIVATKNRDRIDIMTYPIIYDVEFISRAKKIENFYVPCIEDQIILKILSTRKKDLTDVKKYLSIYKKRLDVTYLLKRASQAGRRKQIEKLLKIVK